MNARWRDYERSLLEREPKLLAVREPWGVWDTAFAVMLPALIGYAVIKIVVWFIL